MVLPVLAALVAAPVGWSSPAAARGAPPARAAGPAFEALVLDAATGQVLRSANPDQPTYPASLTKMMTLYLTFEALNNGRLRADQMLPVSSEAAGKAPTKLGLQAGDSVVVRDLILGLVTRSANDAAAVLAEALGGSEQAFAAQMTDKARQLGMEHTYYHNASGLPDPEQHTTARDQARLALALYRDFPREYRFFSTREFEFRGQIIKTHNHLLEWYDGLDGIKTGYVHASGFNLAASAVRNGRRLIGVIMGGNSAHTRDQEMAALLDQGFADIGVGPAPMARNNLPPVAPAPIAPAAVAVTPAAPPGAVPAPLATTRPTASGIAAVEVARERPGSLSDLARNALHHLSPVARAEAAPMLREPAAAPGEDWGIQLGAFRSAHAAELAIRHAAEASAAHGKQREVVHPVRGERVPLYRARLYPFSQKAAQSACAALHKKGVECTIVRPSTRLASS